MNFQPHNELSFYVPQYLLSYYYIFYNNLHQNAYHYSLHSNIHPYNGKNKMPVHIDVLQTLYHIRNIL